MEKDEYAEIQVLEYNLKQIQQVIDNIATQMVDIENTIHSLNEFNILKGDEEVLFNIASGIFAKGKLLNQKSLIINVGQNTVVEKSVEDAIKMIDKQRSEMVEYKQELMKQMELLLQRLEELQSVNN